MDERTRQSQKKVVKKKSVKPVKFQTDEEMYEGDSQPDADAEESSDVKVVVEEEEPKEEQPEEEAEVEEAQEEAEEEEPEEEEAEEEEAEEEEAEEVAPRPKRAKKKAASSGMSKKLIAVIIVIILLIVVVAAAAFLFVAPNGPKAKITVQGVDLNNIQAGRPVTFDANSSSKGSKSISTYSWDFGDGTKGVGPGVVHIFSTKGVYTVTLTVADSGGLKSTASVQVTVKGMVVTIPMAKLGDTISYDISGFVDMKNSKGFWTYTYKKKVGIVDVTFTAKVTEAKILVDQTQNRDMTIATGQSASSVEDGLDQMHSCINRKSDQSMFFTGWATVLVSSQGIAPSTLNQTISGNAKAQENPCTDLATNKTVKNLRTDSYTVRLGASGAAESYSKTGSDTVTLYPKSSIQFDVNALRSNRTFRTGDSGSQQLQSNTLLWNVVGEDNIKGTPCLKVHLAMDSDTMSKNGFSDFGLDVWISESFAGPMKMVIHSAGTKNGDTVTLNYTTTYKSFTVGTSNIPYGPSGGPYNTKRPGVDYAQPDTYSPAMGPNSPSLSTYPLPNAVTFAKQHSSGLSSYLSSHSNAFLTNAYYNETNNVPAWNLTFGVNGSTQAYNIIVTQSSVKSEGGVTVEDIAKSILDYSTALTFTGAEQVFQSRTDIKNQVYSGNKIDAKSYSFGSKADFPVPKPTIPISTNIEGVPMEYYFYVESKDKSYSAGVDAGNGQVLFINSHTGN